MLGLKILANFFYKIDFTETLIKVWGICFGETSRFQIRFQVLTEASMKITVFWDVVPCSLVEVYSRSEAVAASIVRAMTSS
jgi:hypothetical protein